MSELLLSGIEKEIKIAELEATSLYWEMNYLQQRFMVIKSKEDEIKDRLLALNTKKGEILNAKMDQKDVVVPDYFDGVVSARNGTAMDNS